MVESRRDAHGEWEVAGGGRDVIKSGAGFRSGAALRAAQLQTPNAKRQTRNAKGRQTAARSASSQVQKRSTWDLLLHHSQSHPARALCKTIADIFIGAMALSSRSNSGESCARFENRPPTSFKHSERFLWCVVCLSDFRLAPLSSPTKARFGTSRSGLSFFTNRAH